MVRTLTIVSILASAVLAASLTPAVASAAPIMATTSPAFPNAEGAFTITSTLEWNSSGFSIDSIELQQQGIDAFHVTIRVSAPSFMDVVAPMITHDTATTPRLEGMPAGVYAFTIEEIQVDRVLGTESSAGSILHRVNVIPEPGVAIFMLSGLIGLASAGRKR